MATLFSSPGGANKDLERLQADQMKSQDARNRELDAEKKGRERASQGRRRGRRNLLAYAGNDDKRETLG